MASVPVTNEPGAQRRGWLNTLRVRAWNTRSLPYFMVPLLFILLVATIQGYFNKSSIISLFILASLLGLASLGQTIAIIAGGIDLSIPSVIGLSEIILTQLYASHWPFWEITLAIAALSIVIGTINAGASVIFRVHPLITTFGMGLVISGVALEWSNGFTSGAAPAWLSHAVSPISHTGPIPVPSIIVVWVVASLFAIGFLRLTRLGRESYTNGTNPVAARLAGVRSTWVLIVAFSLSALFASLVGMFFAGYSGLADPTVGQPYFFETITAVVIGGTSLLGGLGGYGRTIVGALLVAELTTLLIGYGYGVSVQEMALGLVIILLGIVYGRDVHISTRV